MLAQLTGNNIIGRTSRDEQLALGLGEDKVGFGGGEDDLDLRGSNLVHRWQELAP